MDVKFDSVAAERLIQEMSTYCSGVMNETRDLLQIIKETGQWSDNQSEAFRNNITELAKDLNKALSLESEYMRTFHQRVTELRG